MKKKIGISKKSSVSKMKTGGSMKSMKPMKKYAMAGEVDNDTDDIIGKAKGIVKKGITKAGNKVEQIGSKVYNKVKDQIPSSVKRAAQDVYGNVKKAAKAIDNTNFKKGGSVKKKK